MIRPNEEKYKDPKRAIVNRIESNEIGKVVDTLDKSSNTLDVNLVGGLTVNPKHDEEDPMKTL